VSSTLRPFCLCALPLDHRAAPPRCHAAALPPAAAASQPSPTPAASRPPTVRRFAIFLPMTGSAEIITLNFRASSEDVNYSFFTDPPFETKQILTIILPDEVTF